MRITLKNGETVKLDWNWLVVEYIDKEIKDFNKLAKLAKLEGKKNITAADVLGDKGVMELLGTISYAIIQANTDKEYTRNQIIRLLEFGDMFKILNFMMENEEEIVKVVDIKK